jgi:hypothetical protein
METWNVFSRWRIICFGETQAFIDGIKQNKPWDLISGGSGGHDQTPLATPVRCPGTRSVSLQFHPLVICKLNPMYH